MVFEEIKFGSDNNWKPVQTGIILSTKSILDLQFMFLHQSHYLFLLTSRFSQDCLENLFSSVRIRQKAPSPLEFKRHLKLITVSQYMKNPCSSSYNEDDRNFLGDFFSESTSDASKRSEEEDQELQQFLPLVTSGNNINICDYELSSLYNLAGYVVFKVKSLNKVCEICVQALLLNKEEGHCDRSFMSFVESQEYKEDSLVKVNKKCFDMFTKLEQIFRKSQMLFPEMKNIKDFLRSLLLSQIELFEVPDCHVIKEKLLNRFITLRMRIYAEFHSASRENGKVDFGSKSMCMRALAKNLSKREAAAIRKDTFRSMGLYKIRVRTFFALTSLLIVHS